MIQEEELQRYVYKYVLTFRLTHTHILIRWNCIHFSIHELNKTITNLQEY